MTVTTTAEAHLSSPTNPMYDLEDLQADYRIGKTKAIELADSDGFPNSVVPGMRRYPRAAVEAYDLAVALAGTVADPANAVPPAPLVLAPPAPGKPGPKRQAATTRKAA